VRPTLARAATCGALAAGVVAAAVVPDGPPGLGVTLAALAVLAAAWAGGAFARDRWTASLLGAAALLAAAATLRDARWLVACDLAVALGCASTASAGGTAWRAVVRGPWAALPAVPRGLAGTVRGASALASARAPSRLLPALRGLALAVVLVATFGALFASADRAFAELAGQALPATDVLDDVPRRLTLLLLAVTLTGALVLTRGAGVAAAAGSPPRRALAPTEWGIALAALIALFAAFVAVQVVVLFGGDRHVLRTAGLTYAEYAHQGFGQLVVVAGLVIGVVAVCGRWARRGDMRVLRALLAALCVLTLVVVASALHRLDLYVDAFGATRLRVQAATLCLWIGGLLALLIAGLAVGQRRWLPRAVLALTAATAIALTALNPDAWIAQRNVDRYERTGRIDSSYLASLSADAVGPLLRLPDAVEGCPLAGVRAGLSRRGVLEFNVGRLRARHALAGGRGSC
jgi:Domain of unknown function (DUF4173)